jgi:hypothetical protein
MYARLKRVAVPAVEGQRVSLSRRKARKHQRGESKTQCGDQGPRGPRTFEGVEPMGRGRAKAKQVKVARQLKYGGGGTDLDRLRAELGVSTDQQADDDAAYADFADRYAVDDDDESDDDDDELDDDEDLDDDLADPTDEYPRGLSNGQARLGTGT